MMTKLEVGQVWRRRDGETVTITEYVAEHTYPWKSDRRYSYVDAGSYLFNRNEDPRDLVELISDAP